MATLFGIDIAQIVTDALAGQLRPASLRRKIAVDYNPVTDTETGASFATFTSEGIVAGHTQELLKLGLTNSIASTATAGSITENSRYIVLLAKPLNTTPISGDTITIDDQDYRVSGIAEKDPAGAVFIVRAEI